MTIKDINNEGKKMLSFAGDLENQKKSTKILLEVKNEFYRVVGYNMQPQKSIVLSQTQYHTENKVRTKSSFTAMKNLNINPHCERFIQIML